MLSSTARAGICASSFSSAFVQASAVDPAFRDKLAGSDALERLEPALVTVKVAAGDANQLPGVRFGGWRKMAGLNRWIKTVRANIHYAVSEREYLYSSPIPED